MAISNAALIFHDDGSIEATRELQDALHLIPGSRLELLQRTGEEIRFRMPKQFKEIGGWRDLEGILADSPLDPNADLERDRLRELERDVN
ncbi:MAG: hypothetical protein WBY53_02475 [Acidobacteriaceae bacterium]